MTHVLGHLPLRVELFSKPLMMGLDSFQWQADWLLRRLQPLEILHIKTSRKFDHELSFLGGFCTRSKIPAFVAGSVYHGGRSEDVDMVNCGPSNDFLLVNVDIPQLLRLVGHNSFRDFSNKWFCTNASRLPQDAPWRAIFAAWANSALGTPPIAAWGGQG